MIKFTTCNMMDRKLYAYLGHPFLLIFSSWTWCLTDYFELKDNITLPYDNLKGSQFPLLTSGCNTRYPLVNGHRNYDEQMQLEMLCMPRMTPIINNTRSYN